MSHIGMKFADKHIKRITMHHDGERGTLSSVVGRMGSGKTSFLYFIAQMVQYWDEGVLHPETCIIRGRPLDLWLTLLRPDYDWYGGKARPKRVKVWFYYKDVPEIVYKRKKVELSKDAIGYYTTIPDLYRKLMRGGINVVYPPCEFKLNENVIKLILRRSFLPDNAFENVAEHDPNLWWYEFLSFIVYTQGDLEYMTVIWDEADDIIPSNTSGLRYHLGAWLKDVARDLRKCRISLVCAVHNFWDLDFRVWGKFTYRIWLAGSVADKSSSLVMNHDHLLYLPTGTACVECGTYGDFQFPKLPKYSQCSVSFQGVDLVRDIYRQPVTAASGNSSDAPSGDREPASLSTLPADDVPASRS